MIEDSDNFKLNRRDPWLWSAFILFAIITGAAVFHHHPWRDEALPWLIARDLDLWSIVRQAPSEGAPPLWGLIITPLAKLGFPYASQAWLHYLLALGAVFLILFALPLPRLVRLLLPFSYYFVYEYSVIVRNYVLAAVLLFVLAALHHRRLQRPLGYALLIALLSWTNVHSFAMAGVLAALFAFDLFRQRDFSWRPCIAVAITGLGILSVPLLLTPDATGGAHYYGWRWLMFAGAAALWPGIQRETFSLFSPLAFVWLPLAVLLLRGWRARLVLVSSWAWLAFIFMFKHSGALNHYGLILVFFLFAWCLDRSEEGEPPKTEPADSRPLFAKLFSLIVLAQIAYAGVFFMDLRGKHFSGGPEMAAMIRDAGLEGKTMVAYPAYIGLTLLPYLPGQALYQMEEGKFDTIITWTRAYFEGYNTPFPVLYERMIADFMGRPDRPESILFLCSQLVENQPGWTLLSHNTRPAIKEDEFFYLYRIQLPSSAN